MRDDSNIVFGQKFPVVKGKCVTVRCRDATTVDFVVEVRCEVFAHFCAVAVRIHSSIQNSLFGLPGRILYEQSGAVTFLPISS
jgi:hypothetical protein